MTTKKDKASRSGAQKAADERYDDKRKVKPRLPGTRISEAESSLMDELYSKFDSKSEAIVVAAKYYLENNR